jgi:hypothetical protein
VEVCTTSSRGPARHSATIPRGSIGSPVTRLIVNLPSTTVSASRNAASELPIPWGFDASRFVGITSGWRTSASGSWAEMTSGTWGSGSYSTSISSTASSATAREVAATLTTGWPSNSAVAWASA